MSAYRNDDDLRPRLRVLEELRACDRVVAGALATIANADASEPVESALSEDSPPDLHRAEREADRAAAAREVMRALEHVRIAIAGFDDVPESTRGEWPQPSAKLRRFARTVSGTGIADELQAEVRAWFGALRGSDPRIGPQVRALEEWDEPAEEVALAQIDRERSVSKSWRSWEFWITTAVGSVAFAGFLTLLENC